MNGCLFRIEDSINLLNGILYKDVIDSDSYVILVSHFKGKSYNYIMPKTGYSTSIVENINKGIAPFLKEDYEFSYYIEDSLCLDWQTFIEKNLKLEYSDLYLYCNDFSNVSLGDKEMVIMKKDNFDDFLKSIEECFSGWEDNYAFTKWMLETKEVTTLGVKQDGRIVAFGSYIQREESNMIILINDGTIPTHRRQGLHEYLIKYRCNEIIKKNRNAIIYADVEKDSGSHFGFKKLGFKDGPLFWYIVIYNLLNVYNAQYHYFSLLGRYS